MGSSGGSSELRSTVYDDEFGGFRIVILPTPNWSRRLLLSLLLCVWALFEFITWREMISKGFQSPEPVFFLLLWTLGGAFAFVGLAWNFVGREVIRLSGKLMEVGWELGPFARSRTFEIARIRSFRYSPFLHNNSANRGKRNSSSSFCLVLETSIAIDYESDQLSPYETHRFGEGLSEIESRRLIKTIRQRFQFPEEPEVEPLPIQH
jgi:hypothetical protein